MLLHSDVEECGAAVNERSNFMNTFLNRNEALRTAWKKIQEYCSQYAGRSNQDVQVRWRHDMYGWTEFGVTPNGVPYIGITLRTAEVPLRLGISTRSTGHLLKTSSCGTVAWRK